MSNPPPPHMPDEKELHGILNYTIVAVIGLITGCMIGYLFGQGLHPTPAREPVPAGQHP